MSEAPHLSNEAAGASIERLSRQAAEAKRSVLEQEDFKEYAVRFAALEEVEDMLSTHRISPREVFVPALSNFGTTFMGRGQNMFTGKFKIEEPLSFQDYLKNKGNNGSWDSTAYAQTNWLHSIAAMRAHPMLMDMLMGARGKAKGDEVEVKDKKRETLAAFRNEILEDSERETFKFNVTEWSYINFIYQVRELKKYLEARGLPHDSGALKELVEQTPEDPELREELKSFATKQEREGRDADLAEKVEIVSDFIDDPEYIQQDGNLRKVIRLFTSQTDRASEQYKAALIFSNDLISGERSWLGLNNEWRFLQKPEQSESGGRGLLGIIVTIPEKTLANRIVDLSRIAGEFSCPVYSADGKLLYPEESNVSS